MIRICRTVALLLFASGLGACQSDSGQNAVADSPCEPSLGSHLCGTGSAGPADVNDPSVQTSAGRGGSGH